MKTKFCFITLIVSSIILSCTKEKENSSLHIVSSIEMKPEAMKIIEEYLEEHPQFESFLLMLSPKKCDDSYIERETFDFLLGPTYEMAFHDKGPILFIEFKNKKVFIKCDLEELYNSTIDSSNSPYYTSQIKRKNLPLLNKEVKNGEVLYIQDAIYFSIDKRGSFFINKRPDTLFLPKELESTISFDQSKYVPH